MVDSTGVDLVRAVSVNGIIPLKSAVQEVESQLINKALSTFGTTYKVAKALKVDQSTVVRKIQRYKLNRIS